MQDLGKEMDLYTSMVPSAAVFYALFGLKEEKKAWKQKKIPLEAFVDITGGLDVSGRFDQ